MTARVAWMFPGQGSQSVGMGREFYERDADARTLFAEASGIVGYDLARLCFEGPKQQLDLTEYTQPALLTVSVVAMRLLERSGFTPQAVVGHSLGEYTALVAAGGIAFSHAVALVQARGRYMQAAVEDGRGLVCALLGVDRTMVQAICQEASTVGIVSAANFNAPGQVVIAGEKAAVEEAARLAKAKGCRKVIPLSVSVPVHTALMRPAAERLAADVMRATLHDLSIPLINNADARPIQSAEELRVSLIKQLAASVLWEDSVRRLWDMGVRTLVEVGPGTVLCGLVKRIVPDARVLNVQDPASLASAIEALAA